MIIRGGKGKYALGKQAWPALESAPRKVRIPMPVRHSAKTIKWWH